LNFDSGKGVHLNMTMLLGWTFSLEFESWTS